MEDKNYSSIVSGAEINFWFDDTRRISVKFLTISSSVCLFVNLGLEPQKAKIKKKKIREEQEKVSDTVPVKSFEVLVAK